MATREPSPESAASPVKTCKKCGKTKPETVFYFKHASRYPGLRATVCQDCDNERKRLNLAAHRNEINSERRERHALHRDQRNAQARAWLAQNAERINAQRRAQRATNPTIRQRERTRREANSDKLREQDRAHYSRTKERHRENGRARYHRNVQESRENQKRLRAKNLERVRERDRQYYHKTRPRKLLRSLQWREKHRGRLETERRARYVREYARELMQVHAHRAQKKGLKGVFTPEEQTFCKQYFGYACAICEREEAFDLTLAFDHWIPLASPACPGNDASNIVVLCHGRTGCNNSKAGRNPQQWLKQTFGQRKATTILKRITKYFAVISDRMYHSTPPLADG